MLAVASSLGLRGQTARRSSDRTGYAFDPCFTEFYQNGGETPARVAAIDGRLRTDGLLDQLPPVTPVATPDPYIRYVHTQEHIDAIDAIVPFEGYSAGIGEAARSAVAHVLGAVDGVCSGTYRNAFCTIRPPGHHAGNGGTPAGFCCYSNAAIAALYAQRAHGIECALIVDWDYHHGNSTHALFCDNPAVGFFETYGNPAEPLPCDSPAFSTSVRLPAGAGNDDIITVWADNLDSICSALQPQLIIISAGFDLKRGDTQGRFAVTSQGVSQLTALVMDVASQYANGRIVSMLEGGYSDVETSDEYRGLAACAASHVATLMTGNVQDEDPYFAADARRTAGSRSGSDGTMRMRGNELLFPRRARGPWHVQVFDGSGRMVFERHVGPRTRVMPLPPLAAGRYRVHAIGPDGSHATWMWSAVRR